MYILWMYVCKYEIVVKFEKVWSDMWKDLEERKGNKNILYYKINKI